MDTGIQVAPQLTAAEAFASFEKQALEWLKKAQSLKVTDPSQTEMMEQSKEVRLVLKKLRVSAEKAHKDYKLYFLEGGREVDALKNNLIALISPVEAIMQDNEDFVQVQEEKAREAIQVKRRGEMAQLIGSAEAEKIQWSELSEMVYENMKHSYISSKNEREAEAEKLRLEKIQKDEDDRKENERIRKENEALRKVNARKEKLTQAGAFWFEPTKSYDILNAKNGVLAFSFFDIEVEGVDDESFTVAVNKFSSINEVNKQIQTEELLRQEKKNRETETKLKEERAERKRLEDEAEQRRLDEEKIRKDKEKSDRKAKRQPDRMKLLSLAEHIQLLPLPDLKEEEAKAILRQTQILLSKTIKYLTDNANNL